MELEASLSWLATTMTPGIAARLSARLLLQFGSADGVFRASLTSLEACNLPAPLAQAIFKKIGFLAGGKRGGGCASGGPEAGDERGRRDRRTADTGPGGFSAGRRGGINTALSSSQKMIYEILTVEELRPIDDIVETSGLNSSEVLATLFDLELKEMVGQIHGKQFSKVLL